MSQGPWPVEDDAATLMRMIHTVAAGGEGGIPFIDEANGVVARDGTIGIYRVLSLAVAVLEEAMSEHGVDVAGKLAEYCRDVNRG